MTGNSIRAVGAYAPRFRITAEAFEEAWGQFHASGIEEKAVPGADEDALTMAAAAAKRALATDGSDGDEVSHLAFASTTPPLAEADLTSRLGAALGVPETATRRFHGGSTRAGTSALADAVAADLDDGLALVVAADCPKGHLDDAVDHAAGAGAVAFVLGGDGAATVADSAEYATPYPGTRFRQAGTDRTEGLDVTTYDRTAFREVVTGAVDALDADPEPDAVAIQAADGKRPYRVAGALGVDNAAIYEVATVQELGDTGAASAPLSLARALAAGVETTLVVGVGSGAGADALVVVHDDEEGVAADLALDGGANLSYAEYLRQRGEVTSGPPDGGGAYVSVPSWKRSIPQRYRLEAGRCLSCDALNFPPAGACESCNGREGTEPVELPGTGTVEAVTTISQGGAPPEFAEQQSKSGDFAVAVVALDGPDGGSVSVPVQVTDADPGSVGVGDAVTAEFRRIYTQEGVTRYGCKVTPAE
ncbi:OB-fold domain-containing protein [Haloarchaeobius iranensis]|uniref:Hydroxymethylglutaryl-CoA synthase n=1 Tax=Haloarchaeobius iranensis TaxID=996166 RepID=A0A1G9YVS5_9EURY|nr:OB-fold domain-containing protein [Haloarchaeobius iranensis]SDN13027.1 hydroxymethylglutaryl-CoA synthase [Haloarchaeobius iranensis]